MRVTRTNYPSSSARFWVSYATPAGYSSGPNLDMFPPTDSYSINGFISSEVLFASLVEQDWQDSVGRFSSAYWAAYDMEARWNRYAQSHFINGEFSLPSDRKGLQDELWGAFKLVDEKNISSLALVSFAGTNRTNLWGKRYFDLRMAYIAQGSCAIFLYDPNSGSIIIRLSIEDGTVSYGEVRIHPFSGASGTRILLTANNLPLEKSPYNHLVASLLEGNRNNPALALVQQYPDLHGVVVLDQEM